MSQSAPWSVKGVDSQTRETAKVLARRSGMTLGQWLENVIAAREKPEPPLFRDLDSETASPLATIARRLEAGGRRHHDGDNPDRRREENAGSVSAAVLARHIRASEARMANLVERLIRRQEESESQIAALVDAIVDGFAGAQADLRRTAAEPAESSAALDGMAEDLERRLAAMASKLDVPPAQPELEPVPRDDLSEQIAALTQEIAALRRTNTSAEAATDGLADLRSGIAALGQQIADMAPAGQLNQIDKKLDLLTRQTQDPAVLAAIQRETADIRERLGDLIRQPHPSQGLDQRIDALQRAIEDGQVSTIASLEALVARLEALDGRTGDDAAFAALEQQIAGMVKTIDALGDTRLELPVLGSALDAALAKSPLQTLPDELQRLYRELRGLQEGEVRGTQKALDSLQSLLHQIAGRLTAVEDLVRARTTGTVVAGPPDIGNVPPLFGRDRPDDIVWSQELPRSLAGDAPAQRPAEDGPAESRPSQVSVLGEGDFSSASVARSAFIAAARRATRAAAEAEGAITQAAGKPGSENEPFYKRHKRPILLGLAAVTMMMGALQGSRTPPAPNNGRHFAGGAPSIAPAEQHAPLSRPQRLQAPKNEALASFEEARRLDTPQASTLDLAKAAGLYRQAAQMGYAPALFRLGLAYDKGRGVGHDAVLAGLWYQRAAEHGSVNAMYNLAVLYAGGSVMGSPDYEQAARWFHLAAEQGHVASQYNYALLAAQGLGTPRDLAVSYRFLALAAIKGDLDALAKLNEIGPRLAPGERAAIDAEARGV